MIVATVGYSSNKNNGLLTGCSTYIYEILRDNSMTYIGWPVIAITLSSQAAQEIPPLRPSSTPHHTARNCKSCTPPPTFRVTVIAQSQRVSLCNCAISVTQRVGGGARENLTRAPRAPHPTLPHMTPLTLQLTPTHSDPSLELLYQGVVGVELKDLLLA